MTKKTTKKAAVKKQAKPVVAPSAPVTTIQDLLDAGAALEKRVAELEMRVATLERAEFLRLRDAHPVPKNHFSTQVFG